MHGNSEEGVANAKTDNSHIVYFWCSSHSHYASECEGKVTQSNKETEGHQHLTTGVTETAYDSSDEEDIDFVFLTTGKGVQLVAQGSKRATIPKTWILLDGLSTTNVFSSPCLMQNI